MGRVKVDGGNLIDRLACTVWRTFLPIYPPQTGQISQTGLRPDDYKTRRRALSMHTPSRA